MTVDSEGHVQPILFGPCTSLANMKRIGDHHPMYCRTPTENLSLQSFRIAWNCSPSEHQWTKWIDFTMYPLVIEHNYGKSQSFMGKSTINGKFQKQTVTNYQRVQLGPYISTQWTRPQKQNPLEPNTGKVPLRSSARQDTRTGNSSWGLGKRKVSPFLISCFCKLSSLGICVCIYVCICMCIYIYIDIVFIYKLCIYIYI